MQASKVLFKGMRAPQLCQFLEKAVFGWKEAVRPALLKVDTKGVVRQ